MEKIFVSIRVRPLSKVEATKGSPWKLGSNSITLCNSAGAPIPGQSYSFDNVFDSESSTLEIYETHTKDIIASAVKGFNGTVFAYGQTSSGKTYTMRGSPREPGIIPLAVEEIFRNIEATADREFLLRVSYMEIYNEEINDLLAPENRKLQVHENIERGIFVAGLREEIVVSPEQVLELMTSGETYRHVGETNMNVYSSRSHSIFRMVIESRDRSHDDPAAPASVQSCDAVRVSVLNLVDLAGSERVAKTGAEGARLKEGTHINKSLMTLGTVINKLSEGVEKQGGHVPYRDSKLTRILQPALGGNAKTAVICNITPAQIHVDETKGTLFFASRANRVTNCAQVNEIMTDAALLKRQKKEIEELRSRLQENHSEHWDAEVLNLRNALLKTELERERMALELQQEKAAQAERERRLKEQQQKIENLSTMVINSAVDDRDIDKRSKKNNRRETWCPRIPSTERSEQSQESKTTVPRDSLMVKSVFSTRKERLPPLPPPFESLTEGEDIVPPLLELNTHTFGEEFQSFPSDGSNLDSIFQEPPPVLFSERKRRSTEKSMDEDLRRQLGDLQVQYDDLQLQHELKMREKMLEMKELKEELAFAHSAVSKARKLDSVNDEVGDRRGRSLDGWNSDANVQQLRAQVQNLELEKFYMQKELDTIKSQSTAEKSSAHSNLKELQLELEDAREDAANAHVDLSLALQKISDLQYDQQLGLEQQAALAAHFNELTLEVETTKSSSQAFYNTAVDSTDALKATLMNLQESVIDMKSLRAIAGNQHAGSLENDQELRITLESKSTEVRAYSVAVEEALSEAVSTLESTNTEMLILKADLENALKESDLKSAKLADIEIECAALVESMESIKAEMEDAKNAWDQEVQNQKDCNEVAKKERLALVEECTSLRAAFLSLEEEREVLKEQNLEAETELKEFDVEVQRQRKKIEVVERDLEVAKQESMQVAEIITDFRESSSQKADEILIIRSQVEELGMKISSLEDDLEKKVLELALAKKLEDNLTLEIRGVQQQLAKVEVLVLEKDEKIMVLSKDIVNLETECSGMREDINSKVAEMEQLVHLTTTERAVLEDSKDTAIVDLRKVKEEREELHLIIQDLNKESKQLKQLLSDKESRFGDANSMISSANSHIHKLQDFLVEKDDELEQLKQENNMVVERMTVTAHSLREELESKVRELQSLLLGKTAELEQLQQEKDGLVDRMNAVEHSLKVELERKVEELQVLSVQKNAEIEQMEEEKNLLVERMTTVEQSLKEELEKKIQDLSASLSNFEEVNLEAQEKLKQLESQFIQKNEENERVIKEKEVLLNATVQLQDRISCLEREGEQHLVELKQMESRMASATSEIDDAEKQLNDVHSLLTDNEKERLALQQSLEALENHKAGLQRSLSIKDAELASTSAALTEVRTKFEAYQQQHNVESSQLRSDILGLRKELKAAKAAPVILEKERDGLRKDLEKIKCKSGDIEAKLKSALIEKSKVENEKLNIEREVKQLRQSTTLLNKRESIVDKRRESVACGLSKTKQQLSSTEHALQMKNNELEKTAFDLQLLQDNYVKLEADMVETENASVILKNKLAEAERVISTFEDEKEAAITTIDKISLKLEDELEQKGIIVSQLDALRIEYTAMAEKILAVQTAREKAEAEMKSMCLLRDDLARQLTDAHFGFEEEKAAWASEVDQNDARVQEFQQDILKLTEELEKVQKAQEEDFSARNALQEQLDEAEHTASTARVALQEQLSKVEHCLQCSEQESNQLRQQVELLNSSVEKQMELHRKLQEELFAGKEQYEALKDKFEKREELIVVSEADIQRGRQSSSDLAEEVSRLNRMLQEAEMKCADLSDRNSDFDAAIRKESDEKMQLLEERRALADRCTALEGQISQLEFSFKECRDNESRLLQEIQELKEELQNNMEVSVQQQQNSEVSHRAIELETAWNNDREVAQKQVEKLESQLKMSHTEIESLQTELDEVGMKVKSLYLEVDDMQAALDQFRTEKFMLKQQLADSTARLSSLEDKNEQLEKNKIHLLQLSKAYLTSKTKLQVALDSTRYRMEASQSLCEKLEETVHELDEHKTATCKENDRLLVKLQNLKSRCQSYEDELKEAKSKRVSPEEEQKSEKQISEIMQHNTALQLRLQKSREITKARREEMMKLHEVLQRKEEVNSKLEAALEKAQGRLLKLEGDLYQKSEPQTARKVEGSMMSSGEFTTPKAFRQGHQDVIHTDDTTTLYSNTLASRSKVEELKLQSQSLLRMYKQPWRIQGSPGGSMIETGDHPPPSATLDSHHENLTAPIPTWKRAKTAGSTSSTEFLQPFDNSAFNEDKLRASAFSTRSAPRSALAPVNTQNKLHALGLKRRIQESGIQDKLLPRPGTDETEIKPNDTSSQQPRNFRSSQRFDKENL